MVRVPSLDISGTQLGTSQVVPETNALQVVGAALGGIGQIQTEKEQRDAKAWAVKADTDLRFAGLEELENAKNEAETPDEITDLFFKKLDIRKNEIGKSAPNRFAENDYGNIYEGVKRGLGSQAIQTQIGETQAYRQGQIDDAVQSKINFVRNGGSYSDTMQLIEKDFNSLDEVFSPSELAEYKDRAFKQVKGAQLDSLFERGDIGSVRKLINDPKYNKDLSAKEVGAYRNAIKKQAEENAKKLNILNGIQGGGFIDPKNKDNKKAVDLLFQQGLQEGLLSNDPRSFEATKQLITNTGIMPETLQGLVRASYVSSDPQGKTLAYQLVSDINQSNPNILTVSGLTDKQITEAETYTYYKNQGVPESDAVSLIQNNLYPKDKVVTDFRKQEITKGKMFQGNKIGDIFDEGLFDFDADILDVGSKAIAYQAKFQRLQEDYYLATGDENLATKRAKSVFKVNHGTSKITSDDEYVTDYPPENFYKHPVFTDHFENEDTTHIWMRDQLKTAVDETLNRDVPFENLRLVSDAITEQQVKRGIEPTYQVYEKTEDEGLQLIDRIKFDMEDAVKNKRKYLREEDLREGKREKIVNEMFYDMKNTIDKRFP